MSDAFNVQEISEAAESVIPTEPATPQETPQVTPEVTPEVKTSSEVVNPLETPAETAPDTDTQETAETTPEAPADPFAEFGGQEFIRQTLDVFTPYIGQEFNGQAFLDSLYALSPQRYDALVGEFIKSHSEGIVKELFGQEASVEAIQNALTNPATDNVAGKDAAVMQAFQMSQEDWDLLPESSQEALRKTHNAQVQATQAIEQQRQEQAIQAAQAEQQNFIAGCQSNITAAIDKLEIKDATEKARIESLAWGALSKDPAGAQLWQTAVDHLQNGEFGLAKSISPRLNTILSSLVAKEAQPFIELSKLRSENDTLKRKLAGERVETPSSSASSQTVPTSLQDVKTSNLWNLDSIADEFNTARASR